jgi:flagellar basal body-associated protein FliL
MKREIRDSQVIMRAILIAILIAVIAMTVLGCGSSDRSVGSANQAPPMQEATNATMAATMTPEMAAGVSFDERSAMSRTRNESADYDMAQYDDVEEAGEVSMNLADAGRKLIITYHYNLETKDMEASLTALDSAITASGGYVENSNFWSREAGAPFNSANFVYRVPRTQVLFFKDAVENSANVRSKTEEGQDITEQYFDTEARLHVLTTQETRLLELLEQSGTLADLIEVERELARVRVDIELLTGSLRKFDNLVELSTFHVGISSVEEYTPVATATFSDSVVRAFSGSINSVGNVARSAVITLIYILPYLILVAIVTPIVLRILKARKDKAAAKTALGRGKKASGRGKKAAQADEAAAGHGENYKNAAEESIVQVDNES